MLDDQLWLISREFLEAAVMRQFESKCSRQCPTCGGDWPEPAMTRRIASRCIPIYILGLSFRITKYFTVGLPNPNFIVTNQQAGIIEAIKQIDFDAKEFLRKHRKKKGEVVTIK